MKIFGIGLSKTGTTSLANALRLLGYRTVDNMGATEFMPGDVGVLDHDSLETNDAFTDTPIPSFYPDLDRMYPGSKFILTIREEEAWLKSCKKQFNKRHAEQREDAINRIFDELYGTSVFDEEQFRAGYRGFVEGVKRHFADRPGDLLIMDVAGGDGWETLCPFLGCSTPDVPFPKANVTKLTWTRPEDLIELAEAAGSAAVAVFDRFHRREQTGARVDAGGLRSKLQATRERLGKLRARSGRDPEAAADAAFQASLRCIEKRLRAFDPGIPIVSSGRPLPSEDQRKGWNHVWLVEPLGGREHFSEPDAILSVSIALIEDRNPIIAAVNAPTLGVSYFSVAWRGMTKAIGGVLLSELPEDKKGCVATTLTRSELEAVSRLDKATGKSPVCPNLQLCLQAATFREPVRLAHSKEWQTAAAQVVAKSLGRRLVEADSGNPVTYGKPSFDNPVLELR